MPAIATPDECPNCGSEHIEEETRVSSTIDPELNIPETNSAQICQECGVNVAVAAQLNS